MMFNLHLKDPFRYIPLDSSFFQSKAGKFINTLNQYFLHRRDQNHKKFFLFLSFSIFYDLFVSMWSLNSIKNNFFYGILILQIAA